MEAKHKGQSNFSFRKKAVTREQGLQKLRHYCAYQERSHAEVVQKLWDLGVHKTEHDEILSVLIEEDYLNESRFAKAFAGGKFRMKEWGRKKIWHALKEKQVSEYNIRIGLKEINEEDYLKVLGDLAEKKYNTLKGEHFLVRKRKTVDFLLQRGFEPELINSIIQQLSEK